MSILDDAQHLTPSAESAEIAKERRDLKKENIIIIVRAKVTGQYCLLSVLELALYFFPSWSSINRDPSTYLMCFHSKFT